LHLDTPPFEQALRITTIGEDCQTESNDRRPGQSAIGFAFAAGLQSIHNTRNSAPTVNGQRENDVNFLMIVLRIIHIFSGVFWVGFAFFNVRYLQPTVAATGVEGQKVMQYLARKTNLLTAMYTASTLVVLSGLAMYWILSGGFRVGFLTSPTGLILALGGIAGIVAWAIFVFIVRNIFNEMAAIGNQIQAQGGPPTPEQGAALGALSARVGRLGPVGAIILLVALLGMSIAQYV
jgi:hypothetical protein